MAQSTFQYLQLELPKITSLLFASGGFYISFIDPSVRKSHRSIPQQLTHWSTLEKKIRWLSSGLVLASGLLGANAYRLSKQKSWLWGSITFLAIFSFTYSALQSINKQLNKEAEQYKPGVINDCRIVEKLKSWVQRHEIRTILSVIAYGFYYYASSKSTQINS